MKFIKLIEINVLPNYSLFVKFEDGKSGIVNFSNELEIGVFKPLLQISNFSKVKIGEFGHYIYWDIDVPELEKPDASSGWLYTNLIH